MFSTDDSVAYRVIFEGKIKKIGKIYPDFPLVVKTDFLPNYEMVDRFLDKELFNESFFTFAEGLVKKEIDVSSYRLFYNRGEKTAFSRSPYMWILVYADKAALIRTGYISQRTREEPFIGAKYWICNFDNSDIQETKFVNCKKGEKRSELDTSFVPLVSEVKDDDQPDIVCANLAAAEPTPKVASVLRKTGSPLEKVKR
ncbi:hypothetical protein [Leptospira weilii]|uniref:hypothetical protein n=1 Tax=Leptospira weilii TaxID=28184 RepID=UPI000B293005|nr:hypothetical protein [Leptospira weilii]